REWSRTFGPICSEDGGTASIGRKDGVIQGGSVTTDGPTAAPEKTEPPQPGRLATALGPATWLRALALAATFAFLGGAVGWILADQEEDPLSATGIGFLQDLHFHHTQALQMSKILLYKDDIDRNLKAFAEEFLADHRFEQGLFNATLARFGHPVDPGH